MADYSPQAVTLDGITPTVRTAASGDKLTASGDRIWIEVTNGSGGSITLTIDPPGNNAYGVANPAKTFTVAAGAVKKVPILSAYADPSDSGKVALAWSATPSVTFTYHRI